MHQAGEFEARCKCHFEGSTAQMLVEGRSLNANSERPALLFPSWHLNGRDLRALRRCTLHEQIVILSPSSKVLSKRQRPPLHEEPLY